VDAGQHGSKVVISFRHKLGLATRRECLKAVVKTVVVAPALLTGWRAAADVPLPSPPDLPEAEALLLTPTDKRFAHYETAYNRRTILRPKLRALCKTQGAVAAMVRWLRFHHIPFALRSGGHCLEGFSESESVVIDTRLMNTIDIDTANEAVTAGPGASLGSLYLAVGARGYVLSAGSCPTVGVAGHVLGGGYGYLSRQFGLLCDGLEAIESIDADSRLVVADSAQNADLFWASRGGGGGCFGVVTRFRFRLFPLSKVLVFTKQWSLPPVRALTVVKAWQVWAPQAPDAITSTLTIGRGARGHICLECAGQSVGSEDQLRYELRGLLEFGPAQEAPNIKQMSFPQAVDHFSEGWRYRSTYAKGKSDILQAPLSDDGIAVLIEGLQNLPKDEFTAILYAYGGAIARVSPQATAFPYRKALGCIQYDLTWNKPEKTPIRLLQMRRLYDSMRPYVSGGAYVNYCDTELQNWREAYWGPNLSRLEGIKSRFDPDDVFRHAQSV
jgi:FAD binding domain/Berberine and berberine like